MLTQATVIALWHCLGGDCSCFSVLVVRFSDKILYMAEFISLVASLHEIFPHYYGEKGFAPINMFQYDYVSLLSHIA